MFNTERKQEYIEFCEDERVISLFKTTEKFESELKKDVCEMNTEELLEILKIYSKSTAKSERSRLKKYIEWCRIRGFCKINYMKYLTQEKLEAVLDNKKNKYYLSPDKYQEYVTKIKHSSNSTDPDYDVALFMAMYEGIQTYRELVYLTTEDLDFAHHTIHLYHGNQIIVSTELLNGLNAASSIRHLNNKSKGRDLPFSFQKNSIWKSQKETSESTEIRKFRQRLLKIKEIVEDEELSISNISNSGIFNYIMSRLKNDKIHIVSDMKNPKLSKSQLDIKYQKYFEEKNLKIDFWGFCYRFQDYIQEVISMEDK